MGTVLVSFSGSLRAATAAWARVPPRNLRSATAFSFRSEIQEAAMPFLFWAIAPFELMKAWCEAFEIKRDQT
jgi:hypothetical protein